MSPTTYTVTAALPYANGPIHIGHIAGVYLPADIYVRYLRSKKQRVLFLSGSDEHGVPITIRAQQEGKTPQQIVDHYHTLNQQAFQALGIHFDHFARTTSQTHHQTAAHFFTKLHEQGLLAIRETEQYYDPVAHQFLADRYLKGTCPHCAYAEAYGDQCESCGTTLSPEELQQPQSMLSGATPYLRKTQHWYFPLQQYEAWLKQWILAEHKEWKPNVYGQCKAWLDQGLQPRAITRDLTWGIPVPLPEAHNKVLYVWFEAPIGYISATQEWAAAHQQNWEVYWKHPDTQLIHFVGKDNIVFHCILFPAMLKAHGGFILPQNVPANEFLNLEGGKISTSKNRAIWLHDYLAHFPDKQDVLRYVLCANAPENKDSDFTWLDFQTKNNQELVGILGNFVYRTLVLVHTYAAGKVPVRSLPTALERAVADQLQQAPLQIGTAIEHFRWKEALQQGMDLARLGNKYLADTAPWHCIKHTPTYVPMILNTALQLIANLAILLQPFLPFTSQKLYTQLALAPLDWEAAGTLDLLQPGTPLPPPSLLFEKIDPTALDHYRTLF